MQGRFLKLLFGVGLIYIVAVIVMINFQVLFNSHVNGEMKIRFEQKGHVHLQEIQEWMSLLCHVPCDKINVYRKENSLEITMPCEDGKRINRSNISKSITHLSLPLQLIDYEYKLFSVRNSTKLIIVSLLSLYLWLGIYFVYLSMKVDAFENPLKT